MDDRIAVLAILAFLLSYMKMVGYRMYGMFQRALRSFLFLFVFGVCSRLYLLRFLVYISLYASVTQHADTVPVLDVINCNLSDSGDKVVCSIHL